MCLHTRNQRMLFGLHSYMTVLWIKHFLMQGGNLKTLITHVKYLLLLLGHIFGYKPEL